MTFVLKFANGAEMRDTVPGEVVPETCYVKFRLLPDSEDLIGFWFVAVDQLPSGTIVFRETTQERAQKMWRGEA